MAQSNKPRQPIFLTRRRAALITCVITGRWHAAVDVSSHWGTGQDRRQRREPQSIGRDTSLAHLHGHTPPLILNDLLLLSNPASPPCTPIFPYRGAHPLPGLK